MVAFRLTQFEQGALVAILGGLAGSIVGALLQARLTRKVTRRLRRADRRDEALLELTHTLRPIGPRIEVLVHSKEAPAEKADFYGTPSLGRWSQLFVDLDAFVVRWQEWLAVRIGRMRGMREAFERFAAAWDLLRDSGYGKRTAPDVWKEIADLKEALEDLYERALNGLDED